jgi:hypothetical protein
VTQDQIRELTPNSVLQDAQGGVWKPTGQSFFDEKRSTQGRWVAVLRRQDCPDLRVMHLTIATPVSLRVVAR